MIVKNRRYQKKYIYGGANLFSPLWNVGKKALTTLTPKLIDMGKKKAVELVSKGAEELGKKAGKKAADIAKSKFNQLLASKSKSGLHGLAPTDPSKIKMEAPTIDKPLKAEDGLNRGLTRGIGIKLI